MRDNMAARVKTTPSAGTCATCETNTFSTCLVSEDVSNDCCCNLNDDDQREKDGKLGGREQKTQLNKLSDLTMSVVKHGLHTQYSAFVMMKFQAKKLIKKFYMLRCELPW